MNLNALNQINNLVASKETAKTPEAQQEAIRRAAQQFEAVLLNQLTSALNNTGSNDEDSLFGSDGGSGLAKQMFSEQLATTMANSGGIGLTDVIMQQMGANQPKSSGRIKSFSEAATAIKDIRESSTQPNIKPLKSNAARPASGAINSVGGNPEDAEIISTFADQVANGDVDDSVKSMMLDGKLLSSTRARVVPDYAVVPGEKANILSGGSNSSTNTLSGVVSSSAKVNFNMPVSGRISSTFGTRFHPVDHKVKFHSGIDIAVPRGTPVGAAAEGEVVFAGQRGGYGNLVVIRHPDGRESRYGHLDKIFVSVGEQVTSGQDIAASGSTGKSTGPHLHFEIRENGQAVNPNNFLSKVLSKSADK